MLSFLLDKYLGLEWWVPIPLYAYQCLLWSVFLIVFNLHFLMTTDTKHLFMCLTSVHQLEVSIQIFCSFFNWLVFTEFWEFTMYSRYKMYDFYQIDLQIFFPVCGLSFHPFNSVFGETVLEEVQFINMLFYELCFQC